MDLKVVNLRNLKRDYTSFLVICILITVASFILYKKGELLLAASQWAYELKNGFLLGMIILALVFSFFQADKKKKLQALPTIEEKIAFYEKLYRSRLWWHVLACFTSGVLLLLTYHKYFLYF